MEQQGPEQEPKVSAPVLRERPAWAALPVVLVSGDRDIRAIADSIGAAGDCTKPFEIERILAVVAPLVSPTGSPR